MVKDKSKILKQELIDLASVAYERQLSSALHNLDLDFESWRKGTLDARQLNEIVHRYHKDIATDLWNKYVPNHFHDLVVAEAIVGGVLKREELSTALLEFLEPKIRLYRSG